MDFHRLLASCAPPHHHRLRPLHALLVASGLSSSVFYATKLVTLYSRAGDLDLSLLSFRQVGVPDVSAYNSLISAFVRGGLPHDAARFFRQLVASGIRPDAFTFPVAIKACLAAEDGKGLHTWVLKLGLDSDLYVAASLVNMYSRVGAVRDAEKVFEEVPARDLGLWNAMVAGFCQNGREVEALGMFEEMVRQGIDIDPLTTSSVLPVCAPLGEILIGQLIHVLVTKHGLDFDVYVSNALIDMYAKLGRLGDAQKIFDRMVTKDLVTWNSIISAYGQIGNPSRVFQLYEEMKENGFLPDALTMLSVVSAVAQALGGPDGRVVHGFVVKRGWDYAHIFLGNAIIDMYSKLNMMEYARNSFQRMTAKDVVTWNTLITGYSQNGMANEAIDVFNTMAKCDGIVSNQGSLVAVLPAYSLIGALKQGMRIHSKATRLGLDLDLFVGTCLIDTYSKCGRLSEAMFVFKQIPRKSHISWNTIITAHGIHGRGDTALDLFNRMQDEGFKPDHVTFLSLLSACSHAGMVNEGKRCFNLMCSNHQIEPTMKHYTCMVDLLGRSGDLHAAFEFIKNMPMRPDAAVWGALLNACRIYGNTELGRTASIRLFEIDPENVGYYVLLSNMHATAGEWVKVNDVRSLAKARGLVKTPGWSSTELDNKVYVFHTGNQSHPQSREICDELRALLAKMKALGFVPDYSCVLQDVEEDEKDHILNSHSERLAIAFGIINTAHRTHIHIFKNLRVCTDCHTATKFISRISEREIIVRDSNRFHHFKDGSCSCGDYW